MGLLAGSFQLPAAVAEFCLLHGSPSQSQSALTTDQGR
jgi:hypothetical protein